MLWCAFPESERSTTRILPMPIAMTALAILVVFAALCGGATSASVAPSIEANADNSIIVSVPDTAAVLVNKYDRAGDIVSSSPLITQADLDTALTGAKAGLQQQLDDNAERLKALEAKMLGKASLDELDDKADASEVTTIRNGVADGASKVADLRKELDTVLDDLVELTQQQENKSACLGNVVAQIAQGPIDSCPTPGTPVPQCPELSAPQHGYMKGGGRSTGALRLFRCASGFLLRGAATALCGKDLKWTDAVPVCAATVTCVIRADDTLKDVYVDGVRMSPKTILGTQTGLVNHTFKFKSKFSQPHIITINFPPPFQKYKSCFAIGPSSIPYAQRL